MAPRLKPVHMGNVCTSSQSGRADKCVVAALEFGFVWRAIRQSRSSADRDRFRARSPGPASGWRSGHGGLVVAFDELDALGSGIVRNQINRATASLTGNVA